MGPPPSLQGHSNPCPGQGTAQPKVSLLLQAQSPSSPGCLATGHDPRPPSPEPRWGSVLTGNNYCNSRVAKSNTRSATRLLIPKHGLPMLLGIS